MVGRRLGSARFVALTVVVASSGCCLLRVPPVRTINVEAHRLATTLAPAVDAASLAASDDEKRRLVASYAIWAEVIPPRNRPSEPWVVYSTSFSPREADLADLLKGPSPSTVDALARCHGAPLVNAFRQASPVVFIPAGTDVPFARAVAKEAGAFWIAAVSCIGFDEALTEALVQIRSITAGPTYMHGFQDYREIYWFVLVDGRWRSKGIVAQADRHF